MNLSCDSPITGDAFDAVRRVLGHIEARLTAPLSLAELAAVAAYSPFHFHRVFGALAGVPLMTYVRNRKLDESLVELLNGKGTVLDLALRYGFGFEQSYARAFTRRFGATPARLRRNPKAIPIAGPLVVREAPGGGLLAAASVVICPQRVLIGRTVQLALSDDLLDGLANRAARAFMENDAPRIHGSHNPDNYVGLVKPVHALTGLATYVPALEVRPDAPVPAGLERHRIPARRFAVFRYAGGHPPEALNLARLTQLLDFVFLTWLPQSGWRLDPSFHLESIDLRRCAADFTEALLYIPAAPPHLTNAQGASRAA